MKNFVVYRDQRRDTFAGRCNGIIVDMLRGLELLANLAELFQALFVNPRYGPKTLDIREKESFKLILLDVRKNPSLV